MGKSKLIQWVTRLSLILLSLLSIYMFVKLKPLWLPIVDIIYIVFPPLMISGFITYLLHPIIEKLHKGGLKRPYAILLIFSLFFGSVGYGLYVGIPVLIGQIKDLINNLPFLTEKVQSMINSLYWQTADLPEGVHDRLDEALLTVQKGIDKLLNNILSGLKGLISSVILFVIIPFLVFYFLKDFHLIKKTVWYLTPKKFRSEGRRLLRDIDETLGNYIRGQLLVCLAVGIVAVVSLWLAGMKYPLILGTIVGLTNIIPYFGPLIGALPTLIIAYTDSTNMVIIVIVIIFGIQLLEGNLLSPLIVGRTLHMHPVLIIFALLIGGELNGVIGLLLAVPILAVIKVALLHLKTYLVKH